MSRLYSMSRRDRASGSAANGFDLTRLGIDPSWLDRHSDPFLGNQVRWVYRMCRKAGMDQYQARSAVWTALFIGAVYQPTFIPFRQVRDLTRQEAPL